MKKMNESVTATTVKTAERSKTDGRRGREARDYASFGKNDGCRQAVLNEDE
jgi:hypothetical protein